MQRHKYSSAGMLRKNVLAAGSGNQHIFSQYILKLADKM